MTTPHSVAVNRVVRRTARRFSDLFARLAGWIALARERRQLAALDDARLKDLGLTRGEAAREAARPFWDGERRL